ncbi:hypothetical protein J4E89_009316 [Alternaria sp. Ai002NY15]|nr:hypothetical protein J4E89_009316 [Alternaria sp. Ai002NY15]
MKFTVATTLLLATVALASPAPVANPDAVAEPALIGSRAQFREALAARDTLVMPEVQLEERASSSGGKGGGKGGKGTGGKNTTESAASDMLSPSRALQITALGLGVVEVVRLWG